MKKIFILCSVIFFNSGLLLSMEGCKLNTQEQTLNDIVIRIHDDRLRTDEVVAIKKTMKKIVTLLKKKQSNRKKYNSQIYKTFSVIGAFSSTVGLIIYVVGWLS